MSNICDNAGIQLIITVVKSILAIIQWIVPLVLIVLGTLALFKAMTSGKEDDQKKAWQGFLKRLIYAFAIFCVPLLVNAMFSLASNFIKGSDSNGNNASISASDFFSCYNKK